MRIIVSLLIFLSPEIWIASRALDQVSFLTRAPLGFEWVVEHIGAHRFLGDLSLILIYGGAFLGLIGHYARIGLSLASIGLFYLIGWLEMKGATVHCHHLLWFSIALALSPCNDVLRLGKRPVLYEGHRYRRALFGIWSIIAMIFVFPGWYKLSLGGTEWLTGKTLYYTVMWKSAQYWNQPITLSFNTPTTYAPLAWAAILFELCAPFLLLLWQRTGLFLILALGFHLGTSLLLNIHFTNLWPCYVVLVPWEKIYKNKQVYHRTSAEITWHSSRLMWAPLLVGILFAGVTMNLSGWPFACYPTFHQKISHKMPLMSVVVRDRQGKTRRINHRRYLHPNNMSWGENWRLAGFYGPTEDQEILRFAKSKIAPLLHDDDQTISFYQSSIDLLSQEITDQKRVYIWELKQSTLIAH